MLEVTERSEIPTGQAVSPIFVEEALDDPRLSEVAGPKDNGSVGVAYFLV